IIPFLLFVGAKVTVINRCSFEIAVDEVQLKTGQQETSDLLIKGRVGLEVRIVSDDRLLARLTQDMDPNFNFNSNVVVSRGVNLTIGGVRDPEPNWNK
ncbi:hypothetical protein PENTCL1PPCAC_12186, partial [Pristionchus entomophagus]